MSVIAALTPVAKLFGSTDVFACTKKFASVIHYFERLWVPVWWMNNTMTLPVVAVDGTTRYPLSPDFITHFDSTYTQMSHPLC